MQRAAPPGACCPLGLAFGRFLSDMALPDDGQPRGDAPSSPPHLGIARREARIEFIVGLQRRTAVFSR